MAGKSNSSSVPFSHVLQRTNLLKSFRVARVVTGKEMRDLKDLIKAATTSKKEYNSMLSVEMSKISGFSESSDPVPGIVFFDGDTRRAAVLLSLAESYAKKIKTHSLTKNQNCFLILSIIKELKLSQSDFGEVDSSVFMQFDEDDDDDEDDED